MSSTIGQPGASEVVARQVRPVADAGAAGTATRFSTQHWVGVAGRYGWLLVDQAVFAATNLVLNLLFAHWLTPSEYGRFGVTFSGFILLSVLHWFVVVEPLLVESARIRPEQVGAYIATLVRAHVLLLAAAAAISAAAYLGGRLLGAPEAGAGIAAISSGGCALLALATARRLCLAFLTAMVSALIGLGYLVAATATAWLLHRAGLITWLALWAVMSGWSVACACAICAMLLRRPHARHLYRLHDLVRATSRYAAWGSVTAGFSWIRSDGIYAVLALSSGLPAVAQTRAIVTLNAPVPQVNSALNASWLIDFGRRRRDVADLRRTVVQRALLYAAAAVLGVAAVCGLAGWITHLAYGGKYDAGAWLMPLFLAAYLLNGLEGMLTSAMKASGIFRDAYLPQMAGSVGVGAVALLLVPRAGPAGAALAVLAGAGLGIGIAFVLFLRHRRRNG
jgi:O-antigen/teichoic acid export membrane protein